MCKGIYEGRSEKSRGRVARHVVLTIQEQRGRDIYLVVAAPIVVQEVHEARGDDSEMVAAEDVAATSKK
jgi:hypothetical protein